MVEWCADDSVCYDILAFSRPNHWLVRLGYPITRRLQKRFAHLFAAENDPRIARIQAIADRNIAKFELVEEERAHG